MRPLDHHLGGVLVGAEGAAAGVRDMADTVLGRGYERLLLRVLLRLARRYNDGRPPAMINADVRCRSLVTRRRRWMPMLYTVRLQILARPTVKGGLF